MKLDWLVGVRQAQNGIFYSVEQYNNVFYAVAQTVGATPNLAV